MTVLTVFTVYAVCKSPCVIAIFRQCDNRRGSPANLRNLLLLTCTVGGKLFLFLPLSFVKQCWTYKVSCLMSVGDHYIWFVCFGLFCFVFLHIAHLHICLSVILDKVTYEHLLKSFCDKGNWGNNSCSTPTDNTKQRHKLKYKIFKQTPQHNNKYVLWQEIKSIQVFLPVKKSSQ